MECSDGNLPSNKVEIALVPDEASKSAPPYCTNADAKAIREVDSTPAPIIERIH